MPRSLAASRRRFVMRFMLIRSEARDLLFIELQIITVRGSHDALLAPARRDALFLAVPEGRRAPTPLRLRASHELAQRCCEHVIAVQGTVLCRPCGTARKNPSLRDGAKRTPEPHHLSPHRRWTGPRHGGNLRWDRCPYTTTSTRIRAAPISEPPSRKTSKNTRTCSPGPSGSRRSGTLRSIYNGSTGAGLKPLPPAKPG